MEHTIVIEETPRNFAAYAPDLPGCVATGATRGEVVRAMRSAITLHIESLREHDESVPAASLHCGNGGYRGRRLTLC